MIKNNLFSFFVIFLLIGSLPGLHADNLVDDAVVNAEEGISSTVMEISAMDVAITNIPDTESQFIENTLSEESTLTEDIVEIVSLEESPKTNQEETKDRLGGLVTENEIKPSENSSAEKGGEEIYVKLEDLNYSSELENEKIDSAVDEVVGRISSTIGEDDSLDNFSEEESIKEYTKTFYAEGEKVIEIKTFNQNLPEIKKEEKITEDGKEVTISSEEHVEESLRVYSELETETEKENIRIYWETEGEFLDSGIEYYDENGNGLIDKISWIVLHLSTQVFKIIIDSEETDNTQTTVGLRAIRANDGLLINPLNFSFEINYTNTSNVECDLTIKSISDSWTKTYSGKSNIDVQDLKNGSYQWIYYCEDSKNPLVNATINNTFQIAENFQIQNLQEVYLLDWDGNLIVNPSDVIFYNANGKGVNTSLETPKEKLYIGNNNSVQIASVLANGLGNYKIITNFKGLEEDYQLNKSFGTIKYQITVPTKPKKGENSLFTVLINSSLPVEKTRLYFNGITGSYLERYSVATPFVLSTEQYSKNYTSTGSYALQLGIFVNGTEYLSLPQTITVTSEEDTTDPKVTITSPRDDYFFSYYDYQKNIDFKFKVVEDVKLEKCEINIYNSTSHSNGVEDLILEDTSPVNTTNLAKLSNGEEVTISYNQFEEKKYALEMECWDNSSNHNFDLISFEVSYSNSTILSVNSSSTAEHYSKEDLVTTLTERANEFIGREETWTADEKKALDDLGFIDEVKFYKKRLIQIDQDLKFNMKYISSEILRAQKINELNDEIEDINQNLPLNIEIEGTYEYIKNRNDIDWKNLIVDYLEKTSTKLVGSEKSLERTNIDLQNKMTVSNIVKELKIEYGDRTDSLILVTKEIKTKPEGVDKFLEIIPAEIFSKIDEIKFLTDVKVIKKDEIFEVSASDFAFSEIKYTIKNKNLKIKEIEATDTIAFTDKSRAQSLNFNILGFVSFGLFEEDTSEVAQVLFIPFIIVLIIFIFFLMFRFITKRNIKKDPNVFRIFNLIDEIRKDLKGDNVSDARTKYNQIRELYLILNEKAKVEVLSLSKRALIAIDRKDIFNLTNEYKLARKNFQKETAIRLYEEIKQIYTRLDKKDREQISEILNS